jgi:hypothetical protein
MPRHSWGPAKRTHGVRPSEKISFRVNSRPSPLGHLPLDRTPLEGRAPHARKEGTGSSEARRHRLTATEAPILGNERPRHEYGLATRTRGAHPTEKTLFRAIPALPREAIVARLAPWRGGLRTPAMTPLGSPEHVPPGPPGVRSPLRDHAVPRPAPCPFPRTRRPRPSEKTPSRVIPGLAPQGHFALG